MARHHRDHLRGWRSWTTQTDFPNLGNLHAVAFVGTQFVAAGDSGAMVSSDGVHWTLSHCLVGGNCGFGTTGYSQALAATGPSGDVAAIVTHGGILTATIGNEPWTLHGYPDREPGINGNLTTVTWGPSGYVVAGQGGTILTSADGTTWQDRTLHESRLLQDVTWAPVGAEGRYCAVGTGGLTATSIDGTSWEYHGLGLQAGSTPPDLKRVVWASDLGLFVTVGTRGDADVGYVPGLRELDRAGDWHWQRMLDRSRLRQRNARRDRRLFRHRVVDRWDQLDAARRRPSGGWAGVVGRA